MGIFNDIILLSQLIDIRGFKAYGLKNPRGQQILNNFFFQNNIGTEKLTICANIVACQEKRFSLSLIEISLTKRKCMLKT